LAVAGLFPCGGRRTASTAARSDGGPLRATARSASDAGRVGTARPTAAHPRAAPARPVLPAAGARLAATPVSGFRRRTPADRDRRRRAPAAAVRPRAPLPEPRARRGARGHFGARQRALQWRRGRGRNRVARCPDCAGASAGSPLVLPAVGWPVAPPPGGWLASYVAARLASGAAGQRGRAGDAAGQATAGAVGVPTLPADFVGCGVPQRQAAPRVARGLTGRRRDSRQSLAPAQGTCARERGAGRGGQPLCVSHARPVGPPHGRCGDGAPPGRWCWILAPWALYVLPRQRRQCVVDVSPLAPAATLVGAMCRGRGAASSPGRVYERTTRAQSGALEREMLTSGRRIASPRQHPRLIAVVRRGVCAAKRGCFGRGGSAASARAGHQ